MNNEFKKLSEGDVTRYVLENASSGGTSSGSVASVSMPMGGTRKRGDNLIAQEADKNTVPASTPRNFVAKNAKTAGAGAHKDKSKTIPRKEKHKKPFMEDHSTATGGWGQGSYDTYTAGNHGRGVAEDEEYDDEAGMADNNIETMKRAVDGLDNLIHKGDNLPEWCQEKIAVAKSMLVTVWDYMASEEQGVAEGDFGPAATAAIQQGKSPSEVAYADTKDKNNIAKGLKIQQQVAAGDDPTLTNAGNAARRAGNTTVEDEQGVAEGNLEEKAPPGMEAEVLRLKKQYPGQPEKAFATAWSIYNKKHGKTESVDLYFESLNSMLERQLEPTMDLDTWNNNFQNADPNKYHQFKNKTAEKKK